MRRILVLLAMVVMSVAMTVMSVAPAFGASDLDTGFSTGDTQMLAISQEDVEDAASEVAIRPEDVEDAGTEEA